MGEQLPQIQGEKKRVSHTFGCSTAVFISCITTVRETRTKPNQTGQRLSSSTPAWYSSYPKPLSSPSKTRCQQWHRNNNQGTYLPSITRKKNEGVLCGTRRIFFLATDRPIVLENRNDGWMRHMNKYGPNCATPPGQAPADGEQTTAEADMDTVKHESSMLSSLLHPRHLIREEKETESTNRQSGSARGGGALN